MPVAVCVSGASASSSSKADLGKPWRGMAPSKRHWLAEEAGLASFLIESIMVATASFSHALFALGVAGFEDVFLIFFPLSIQAGSSQVRLGVSGRPSTALGHIEVHQKILMPWVFMAYCIFICFSKQCELMAFFPSCLIGAVSGFLFIMSFVIILSNFCGLASLA